MKREIKLGLMAPSIGEQLPEIPEEIAKHLHVDMVAIFRLSIRGYINRNTKENLLKKLLKDIDKEYSRAIAN